MDQQNGMQGGGEPARAEPGKTAPARFFAYPSADGVALFGREWGDAAAPLPVVLLSGLTRNSRDYEALAEALVADAAHPTRVVAFDYRGRGGSGHAPYTTYTPIQEAQDILAGLAVLGISRAVLAGTSRGGLVMFVLAILRPDLFAGAIFNDIGPVVEVSGILRIGGYVGAPLKASWPEAVADLKATQGFMFPALTDAEWERFARQIYGDAGGKPCLSYDPALGEAFKAIVPGKPLPDLWPGFDALAQVPAMVVRGALSDVLSASTVEDMAARHPGLVIHEVADQGHAPLLWDAPAQQAIIAFIRSVS
ncbi:alpha/beta hydrolase fold [Xanthobacter versatilis]|uniref:Alpha/beta hydrolase fold n=1 Tax=Xanthobacter autotrophicus (strain ATCC BAA-1158 / Py2) TaxID=78245 RepID=A7IE21_XANP2|nr:alpha/beta hydrolase fold [Xanthobacter autotrophicus Py2]